VYPDESPALAAIAKKTSEEAWSQRFSDGSTVRHLEQGDAVGTLEGQVLKMFVHMTRAQSVLDIGMFTGTSSGDGRGLPDTGRLVA